MIQLYPIRPYKRQSFVGVKIVTIPDQSMTLREIIKRFVKRQSLPIMQDGVYEDRYTDLEKLAKSDLTIQHEYISDLKVRLKQMKTDLDKKNAPPPPPPPAPNPTGEGAATPKPNPSQGS